MHRNSPRYSGWKAHTERIAMEHIEKGVPVAILRPSIVYGPLNRNWTRGFARALVGRGWPIPRERCTGRCNAVFVEDVVQAVGLVLESDAAVGHAFNVNGNERLRGTTTWRRWPVPWVFRVAPIRPGGSSPRSGCSPGACGIGSPSSACWTAIRTTRSTRPGVCSATRRGSR
jgi:hypothetical protein